ncbi:MAG: zinc ribbon domain-containing protein [Chloroflexota bacterium]
MCCGFVNPRIHSAILTPPTTQENRTSIPQVEAQLLCPSCGGNLREEYTWCPTCGTALTSQPCTFCGQLLSNRDQNCPHCGALKKK